MKTLMRTDPATANQVHIRTCLSLSFENWPQFKSMTDSTLQTRFLSFFPLISFPAGRNHHFSNFPNSCHSLRKAAFPLHSNHLLEKNKIIEHNPKTLTGFYCKCQDKISNNVFRMQFFSPLKGLLSWTFKTDKIMAMSAVFILISHNPIDTQLQLVTSFVFQTQWYLENIDKNLNCSFAE